jgi:hypothetical protein
MASDYPGKELRQDDRGPAVAAVQLRLGVQQTALFGPTTEHCVVEWQKAHGLDPDGIVGPLTWARLFAPDPPASLGRLALREAAARIDIREQPLGSNSGPQVDAFLASVGLPPGQSWCAAFVCYCFEQAAKKTDRTGRILKTGSCSALFRWAQRNGLLVPSPQAGDIFLCIGGETGHYHTGFVAGDPANERFPTIEGNSNTDGSANGYEVAHRASGRKIGTCHYVRI